MEKINNDDVCVICAEKFTQTLRVPVECPKCQFTCCKECVKQSALYEQDPMCLNNECRSFFPDYFLRDLTSKNWIDKTYNPHRAEVLFNRQKSMIPETMIHAERRKKDVELREELSKLKAEQKEFLYQMNKKMDNVIREIRKNDGRTIYTKKEHTTFVKKCVTNNCEGYLNHAYKCTSCNTYACSKCFAVKEEGHVCKEDDLKTAELIKSDTKPCPGCHTHIHKIEGCDQMYCPPCKTAFSWKTGKIVTGVIHNPHYFQDQQMMNNLGRQPGDIPCGGLPNRNTYSNKLNQILPKITHKGKLYMNNLSHFLYALLMFTTHIRNVEIRDLPEMNGFSTHLRDRIEYILGKVEEKSFKKNLIQREKQHLKTKEYNDIYETCSTLLEEITRKVVSDKVNNEEDLNKVYEEVILIIKYVNNCLDSVSKRYKCVRKQVHYYEPKYYDEDVPLSCKYMRVFNIVSNI